MTSCWRDEPSARPSFSDICISIENIVDTAEHLPLPGQSYTPEAGGDQPSPTYSNTSFTSDEDDDSVPLYKNCVLPRGLEAAAEVV